MANDAEAKPALTLDEVAAAARAVAAERGLAPMAARLVATLQSWAQPSLILGIRRDATAEAGFRLVPELTSGAVPPGTERSLAKLVDEPPFFDKPTLVRPGDDIPGFKVRDSWIVPWSRGEGSGFLLLRGIPNPYPPNIGDAAALASQPLWPLVAAEAERLARLERLAAEMGRAAEALRSEAQGALEQLRVEKARAQDVAKAPGPDDRGVALEEARRRTAGLEQKIAGLERAFATADAECEFARGEAKQAKADGTKAEAERRALQEKAEALERTAAAAAAERDKLRSETSQLWPSLESLQREKAGLEEAREAAERSAQEAHARRATAESERDEARGVAATAMDRTRAAEARARDAETKAGEADERARALADRWERTASSLRGALLALRRTPFVPPTLRVSFSGAEGALEADGAQGRPPGTSRVLFLDRDTPSLEALAAELEGVGVDVLIAHYPEEVGFFLRTPDSKRLTAIVCDVMAFRGDQDLLDLFRSWRHELSSLALLLSFKADNPTEAERAQRVPVVLAAGYLPRPLQREAVLDALTTIAKRASSPMPARLPKV